MPAEGDPERYRKIWESQGVVMDAPQLRALRGASDRVSRARAGMVCGALLALLGVPVAVLATPTPVLVSMHRTLRRS